MRAYLLLLGVAMQFCFQPFLYQWFTDNTISKASLLMGCEITKFLLTIPHVMLLRNLKNWTYEDSIRTAGPLAVLFTMQNWLNLIGYSHLDGLTYSLLNQTKSIFSAICLYIGFGK